MTRLKKELLKRKLILSDDEESKYNFCKKLSFIDRDFIILVETSDVLPPMFEIRDKNFRLVGLQNVQPELSFLGENYFNKWESSVLTGTSNLRW